MKDEQEKKLQFMAGFRSSVIFEKGRSKSLSELAIGIFLDGEEVGYIEKDGNVTMQGLMNGQDVQPDFRCVAVFTCEQLIEIGAKAKEIKDRCSCVKQQPKKQSIWIGSKSSEWGSYPIEKRCQ